jgi:iron complex transport system substrate-binding protein
MQQVGLPVFCLDTQDLDDLYRDVSTVGRLLGVEEEAAALVEKTKAGIAQVTAKTSQVADSDRPRVFWLGQEEPLLTAGPDNMIDTLFELAGGANVAADASRPWPTYSLETLLVKDPQVIIVDAQMPSVRGEDAGEVLARLRAHSVWSQISAVKTGRVYMIRTDLIGQPTPRVVDGLRKLAEAFHPDLFGPDGTPD